MHSTVEDLQEALVRFLAWVGKPPSDGEDGEYGQASDARELVASAENLRNRLAEISGR